MQEEEKAERRKERMSVVHDRISGLGQVFSLLEIRDQSISRRSMLVTNMAMNSLIDNPRKDNISSHEKNQIMNVL